MMSISRATRLPVVFGLVAALVFMAFLVAPPRVNFLEKPDELTGAVERLIRASATARVMKISVEGTEVTILAPEGGDPGRLSEWRYTKTGGSFLGYDNVAGPLRRGEARGAPDDLFAPADVDLAVAGATLRAARERSPLPAPVNVARVEIARRAHGLPPRVARPVGWTVELRGARDVARVHADARGHVTGADSGLARRPDNLNLFVNRDALTTALRTIHATLHDAPVVLRVVIAAQSIAVHTNQPETSNFLALSGGLKSFAAWTWTPGGLRRGMGQIARDIAPGDEQALPFALGDIDWPRLMEAPATALARLDTPRGAVAEIEVAKFDEVVASPLPGWKVRVVDHNREKAAVLFAADGEISHVDPPESRRPAIDWRDPGVMIEALARIGRQFGPDARFNVINFSRDGVSLTTADPRRPGDFASFRLMREGFGRETIPSMFAAAATPFTLAEISGLTAAKIAELAESTTTRLGLPEKSIASITIGRVSMDPSPRGDPTIEIRAEERPFGRAGRVNYELDGRPIKVYTP